MMGDAKDCDTCEYEHELPSHPACADCVGGNWKPKPETVLAQKDKTIAELDAKIEFLIDSSDERSKSAGLRAELACSMYKDRAEHRHGRELIEKERAEKAEAQLAALRDALKEVRQHNGLTLRAADRRAQIINQALAADAGKGDAMTWREASAHADADFKKIEAGSREVREADGEELRKLMGDDAGKGEEVQDEAAG